MFILVELTEKDNIWRQSWPACCHVGVQFRKNAGLARLHLQVATKRGQTDAASFQVDGRWKAWWSKRFRSTGSDKEPISSVESMKSTAWPVRILGTVDDTTSWVSRILLSCLKRPEDLQTLWIDSGNVHFGCKPTFEFITSHNLWA